MFHRIDTRDRLITSCLTHADPDLLTARTQHFSKGDLAAMLYLTQHPLEAASTIANLSYTGTEPKVVQLVAEDRLEAALDFAVEVCHAACNPVSGCICRTEGEERLYHCASTSGSRSSKDDLTQVDERG